MGENLEKIKKYYLITVKGPNVKRKYKLETGGLSKKFTVSLEPNK